MARPEANDSNLENRQYSCFYLTLFYTRDANGLHCIQRLANLVFSLNWWEYSQDKIPGSQYETHNKFGKAQIDGHIMLSVCTNAQFQAAQSHY